jgi:hypothetical protein
MKGYAYVYLIGIIPFTNTLEVVLARARAER